MKKFLLIVTVIIISNLYGNAQEIGVRFGNISGGNVAIDGIFGTGQFSRIHADISFGDGAAFDAVWDFIYRPIGDETFNLYAGAGPYAVLGDNIFDFGVTGEIGIEYRFPNIPITLGIDWRPMLEIIDLTDFHTGGFGLNIRYVLGDW